MGDIDTTPNHPFYVIDRGWVAAGDLHAGDEIYLLDGSIAYVTGSELEQLSETIKADSYAQSRNLMLYRFSFALDLKRISLTVLFRFFSG